MREISLSRGLVALVDDEDYEYVLAAGPWHAARGGRSFYARHSYWRPEIQKTAALLMHRLITGWPFVDHVNCNGLDNRRCNLRPATPRLNLANTARRTDNRSGFKGVHRHANGRWVATVARQYLGLYDDPVSAALAYDTAARRHFGEYARLNFPLERAS